MNDQIELHLPAPSANEIIRDRLAALVEQFNAATDPQERVELNTEIRRLRGILALPNGGTK